MTDTLEELKLQFVSEQTELTHHGVPGMKWGKRKAATTSSSSSAPKKPGFYDKPSVAKSLLLNSYGKKSSYTDPAALKVRKAAGKLRIAGIVTSVAGNVVVNTLGKNNVGAQYVGMGLSQLGGLTVGAGSITGAVGAHKEQAARRA